MEYRLPHDEPQLIGRSSEALPISDQSVSRRHAELTPDGGRWWVRDLDSANGTMVNGGTIDGRVELRHGDQIRCGSTVLRFSTEPDVPEESPIRMLGPEEMDDAVASRVGPEEPPLGPLGGPVGVDVAVAAGGRFAAAQRPSGAEGSAPPAPAAAAASASEQQALRFAAEHLRVIYEVAAITASALTAEELLSRILELVFKEFRPQRGFILLRPEGTTRLVPAAVRYRQRPRTSDEGHIPVSRTIVNHVLQRSEGILATNAMNDARFRSGDSVREYGIRTAICVPVRSGRRTFGVVHIDSAVADFSWSESELRLMNHIGQHVGLALEGAELIQQAVQRERLAAMGETVANLSHSIKNILQGLRGGADAVELAINRGDLDTARQGWPIISRNLDRILQLTLNMLAWSKPRALDIDLVAVEPLLREVVELVEAQAARRGVALAIEIDPAMPPVPMDAGAMHQALVNLVTNAIDAAPERTGRVVLRAHHQPAQESAEISVTDNGPGVPPELRDRLFEPFVSTKGQRGTGLGLAVTRKIAEEHGGAVGVQSEPGRGATFAIVLPLGAPAEELGRTRMPRPGVDELEGELE